MDGGRNRERWAISPEFGKKYQSLLLLAYYSLPLALGVEAVKIGKSVFFATLGELVASLAEAEREGQLLQRIRFLSRNSLLIIDEIG